MRKRAYVAACGTLLAAAASVLATAGTAVASPVSPVVGHTYVNDNAASANTIAGFDRHADGSLTPIAGSPFSIGGAGLGAGLGSQGAIQASPDRRFLLAVDAGSNQISVLRIGHNGVPTPVGAPVSSGGVEPVSIAINRFGLVYVANVGNGGSNYSGFFLTPAGKLIPLPYTKVAVPEGSGVGDVLFNSSGDRLVGTRDTTSLIDSFTVRFDGRIVPAVGSPFTAQSLGPIGAEFRPTNPSQLYVSNAHAGAGLGTVSAFSDSRQWDPHLDRQLAGPGWADRSMLGRDQSRRPIPVRRQHRFGDRLQLRNRSRRIPRVARHRTVRQRRRGGRCPTVPGRQVPVGHRRPGPRRQHICRQRRHADRAS